MTSFALTSSWCKRGCRSQWRRREMRMGMQKRNNEKERTVVV
jgi:hypothetical protein